MLGTAEERSEFIGSAFNTCRRLRNVTVKMLWLTIKKSLNNSFNENISILNYRQKCKNYWNKQFPFCPILKAN